MTKGIIFDLTQLNNGFYLKIFQLFTIGYAIDDHGYGKYITFLIGIYKLEFTLSITWRTALNGNEKNKKIHNSKKRKKAQATTASA